MLDREFRDSLPYHLYTTAHAIERAMGRELAGCGITFRQCQMLGLIAAEGSITQADAAGLMGVEPSSVARLVDRMCRDGWVERRADPADRRKHRLHATARAVPVWDAVRERGTRAKRRATRGLSGEDLHTLKTLLARVRDNLADDPPAPPPEDPAPAAEPPAAGPLAAEPAPDQAVAPPP